MRTIRKILAGRASQKIESPQRNQQRRIHSALAVHDWTMTGERPIPGYEDIIERFAVCDTCGMEVNGFTATPDEFRIARRYGCARKGFDGIYKKYDQLLVGNRLDQFESYAEPGFAITSNAGGSIHRVLLSEVRPYLIED